MANLQYLSDFLVRNAQRSPGKLAVVMDDESLTWRQLLERVDAAAATLVLEMGVSEQKIVAVLMPNSLRCVITYLAIWRAGHVVLPLDVIYKTLEIDAMIKQLSPALIITDQQGWPRIKNHQAPIIKFDELTSRPTGGLAKCYREDPEKQLATLIFTSGTTGRPKVTTSTHANYIWNVRASSKVWDWTEADSLLISIRLSHWYGIALGLNGVLYHGGTLYLQDHFSAEDILKILASGKISFFTHTPLAYSRMLEVQGEYDLSKVRLFVSGSAPLPPTVWREFYNRFGHKIVEAYGSSETGRIAANPLDDPQPGSPGLPLPGVKLKISPKGEVLIKSKGLFPGYYKNPAATRKAMTSDGWWRTGDIGRLEDGRLFLRGRLKERIRRFGYSVSPRDIEWALHQCPGVKEVQVVGVQRADGTDDRIVYFIVGDVKEKAVIDFGKQNLPSVWRPDKIIMLDSMPRSRLGKIQLKELKEMAASWIKT